MSRPAIEPTGGLDTEARAGRRPPGRAHLVRGALLFATLVAALALMAAGNEGAADSRGTAMALAEGNRHFRDGRLEEALASYRLGWVPENPHPTLVYNLATTLHHLDRLPEAILWYRRAETSGDPWLEENLWLARRSLGSQVFPPSGLVGGLAQITGPLFWLAVIFAWAGCAFLAMQRFGNWPVLVCAILSALLYSGAQAVERWGPGPAVLLVDCTSPAGDLPAGTEAWVRPSIDGGWQVSGTLGVVCPPDSLELISPRR